MSARESRDGHRKETSFITTDQRPDPAERVEVAVLPADAPPDEIRRRAGELLGPLLSGMLGIGAGSRALRKDQVCVRSEQVTFTEVEGETVLLDLASGHYFTLNPQGTAIWEMLTGENDLGAVHASLCRRFRVDAETAWEDLVALVRNLCREKLAKLEG